MFLEEYHACLSTRETSADFITYSEALDPSLVEVQLHIYGASTASVASGEKQEAIQAYLTLSRSKEEIDMLKEDAANIVAYYVRRKKVVYTQLQKEEVGSGAKALLHQLLAKTEDLLQQAYQTVQVMEQRQPDSGIGEDDSDSIYSSDDDID